MTLCAGFPNTFRLCLASTNISKLAWYLCIYMHRESGSDSEVDPIVKLIWSKVCITIYITISITSLITIVAQVCRGSHHGVPGTVQGVQRSAIVVYLALSKGGPRVHYPRVTTIQGWFWSPLSKGGHYRKVRFSNGK